MTVVVFAIAIVAWISALVLSAIDQKLERIAKALEAKK